MRDIQGYEGRYAITSCGKVWSYLHKKFLNPETVWNGYKRVQLTDADGNRKHYRVHRLVAETYIPNDDPENKPCINHVDENKENNCVNNLQWVSHSENINYGSRNDKTAEKNSKAVLCVELNKIFKSQKEAAEELGISASGISACVNGKLITSGGYHWERIRADRKYIDDAIAADLLLLELEENCV